MVHRVHHTLWGNVLVHEALRVSNFRPDGYDATFKDLIFSVSVVKQDEDVSLCASVSRRDRKTPTFADMLTLREYTLPPRDVAYLMFPPRGEYPEHWKKGQALSFDLWVKTKPIVEEVTNGVNE